MLPILNEPVALKITATLFVPAGSGAPVHRNRSAHGLAFNVAHSTVYRFQDGLVLTCQPGQMIYLPQGSSYTVDRSAPSDDPGAGVHAINFHLAEPLSEIPFVVSVRNRSAMLGAFQQSQTAWRQKQTGYREVCFARLYTIFSLLLQSRTEAGHGSRTATLLAPAMERIHETFTHQELPVAQLADLCGISQQYLRRLFHEVCGCSPAIYIRNLRLRYARELLATGEYTVSQAAVTAGFNDSAYFSREFRKFTGQSPSDYRAENKSCTPEKNKL